MALAPWGTVEEVRSSKRSDKKTKDATERKDAAKAKGDTRTSRADKDRSSEPKSKSSSTRSGTSVAAASKIYSNGKTKGSSSTSKSNKASPTSKTSSSSHSISKTKSTSSSSSGSTVKTSDASLKAKEKQRLGNDIKKLKDGNKDNNIKQRQKEDKTMQSPSAARSSSTSARSNNVAEEKVKPKVRESRNGKVATQTVEKRQETSGRSRRGSTVTHEALSLISTKERIDTDSRSAEAKDTSSASRSSNREHGKREAKKTSDRSEASRKSELELNNGETLTGSRRSSGSLDHDSSVLLPNKGGDKISQSSEKLVNGYDVATPGGGRTSRAGSGRSSRSRGASGSEVDNYSDDFSSYGSDFDSDVEDDHGEGTETSSDEEEEEEPEPHVKRVQFQEPEEPPEKIRQTPTTSEKLSINGPRKTSDNKRAHEILSFVHLDRSKHLALHFEGLKYDSYMAAFGARDRRQEAIQTIERVEEECQTEPGLTRELWTQHPPKGAQGPVMGAGVGVAHVVDPLALSRFVQSAASAILELLEEDLDASARVSTNSSSKGAGISGLSVTQVNLPLFDSLPVLAVASAPSRASRIACVFKTQRTENENGPECSLGLWDSREPARPKELLTCRSSPQRLTWLGDEILVATLDDSSLAAWDLRRTTTSITPTAGFGSWGGIQVPQRGAAFSSALAVKELCQIVGLSSFTASRGRLSDDEEEASVVTLDFEGHLVFWSLLHIQETDNALDDLAVAPQSTIKLVRSAGVKLSLNNMQFTSLSVIDQELFTGLDDGGVFHLSRHAAPKFPKTYTARPSTNSVEAPSGAVTCLCGVGRHLVVASGTTNDNSLVRIFDRISAYPLRTVTHWAPISSVVGVCTDPEGTTASSMALLVNADHQLCRLDLTSANVEPLYENVQSLSVHKSTETNYLVIGRVDGAIEVHSLS